MSLLVVLLYIIAVTLTMSTPLSPQNSLKFFNTVGKLKLLKRTGWIHKDIPLPESVADHMYRMSMLSFCITDPTIDRDRLLKVCLVHDLAEAVVGDITPNCGVSKEQKRQLEEVNICDITFECHVHIVKSLFYANRLL